MRLAIDLIPADVRELAESIGADPLKWVNQCHLASIQIVKSGRYGADARVARGVTNAFVGQHSWVVVGDPYDPKSRIIDPTLWCYAESVNGVIERSNDFEVHKPHGLGNLWLAGPPITAIESGEAPISLEVDDSEAAFFLEVVGDLGISGWMQLLGGPMQGWPSKQILEQAYENPKLKALIPIDMLGMVTDINPGDLYLP